MATEYRVKATKFIIDLSISLRLPHSTTSAACAFMHRCVNASNLMTVPDTHLISTTSQIQNLNTSTAATRLPHRYEVGATCVWIACKIEESMRRVEDLILATIRLASKKSDYQYHGGPQQDKEFRRWMEVLLSVEWKVVMILGMDVYFDQPFGYIELLVRKLRHVGLVSSADEYDTMTRMAWCWLNDAMRSSMWVEMKARDLAAIAIILSAAHYNQPLPPKMTPPSDQSTTEQSTDLQQTVWTSETRLQWVKELGVDDGTVVRGCKQILALYELKEVRPTLEGAYFSAMKRQERFSGIGSAVASGSRETVEVEDGELGE